MTGDFKIPSYLEGFEISTSPKAKMLHLKPPLCAIKALILFVFLLSFMPAQVSLSADFLGVRFGPQSEKTRIVFDLVGSPQFDVSGDDYGQGRLFVDFEVMKVDGINLNGLRGKGHIQLYKANPNGQNGTRFTFEFGKTARIEDIFILEPTGAVQKHRLVIDLQTANLTEYLASLPHVERSSDNQNIPKLNEQKVSTARAVASPQKDEVWPNAPRLKPIARLDIVDAGEDNSISGATPSVVSRVTAPSPTVEQILQAEEKKQQALNTRITKAQKKQRETRRTKKEYSSNTDDKIYVVIDPGHGGGHPGAVGPNGTLEKDVNLEAAKSLAAKLASTGRYRPILTRIDDRKVELEDRSRIARDVDAKLFISLHADGNENKELRGSSVYTLSEGGAKRSLQEAREQEDYTLANDYGDGENLANYAPEVGQILFDVAQTKSKNASEKLASLILPRLGKVVPLVKNAKRTEDLKVLLRPDVPAVLVEMAFISNVEDEKNLNNKLWREKTMGAVALAIDDYFFDAITVRQANRSANGHNAVSGGAN